MEKDSGNRVEFQRYNSFFKDSNFSCFISSFILSFGFYSLSIAKLKFDELLDVIYKVEFDFLYSLFKCEKIIDNRKYSDYLCNF